MLIEAKGARGERGSSAEVATRAADEEADEGKVGGAVATPERTSATVAIAFAASSGNVSMATC